VIVTCPHGRARGAPKSREACPGCAWLGVEYAEQLDAKRAAAARALERYTELATIHVDATQGADPIEGYRTRAKWIIGPGGAVGLYTDATEHAVVDIPQCKIAAPVLREVADVLRQELARHEIRGLHAVDVREAIRDGRARAMVTLVVDDGADAEAARELGEGLAARMRSVAAVFVNVRPRGSAQILGRRTLPIAGARELADTIGSVTTIATPGSFVQAHRGQAAMLERMLLDRAGSLARSLGRAPRVLELYAGAGAFSLALASSGAEVVAVESYGPAVGAMREAASTLGMTLQTVVEDAATYVEGTRSTFDLVVVDPPRRGLPPSLRAGIARLAPSCVAYVSCDPATFARDLAHFARLGLAASRVSPIDMIPLTDHVEMLGFLDRSARFAPAVLATTDPFVLVDKPPHEQARPPAPGATPLLMVDEGASGVVPWSVGAAEPLVAARVRVLVSGVPHKRGNIRAGKAILRYERLAVHGGHSEILVTCEGGRPRVLDLVLDRLASFGHPPLGDAHRSSPASLRHAFEAHGIDRPMVHVEWAKVASVEATSRPPGDFAAALESLAKRPA
jgi:23S rRNA (uracil1939-C5)-methyltransferase